MLKTTFINGVLCSRVNYETNVGFEATVENMGAVQYGATTLNGLTSESIQMF